MVSRFPACRRSAAGAAVSLLAAVWPIHSGQAQTGAGTFVAGSRTLFTLDLASAPAGGMPKGVTLRRGKATVVTKDGSPMLKASEPTELLVTLPEALPDGFTIEFEVIPKACCNPEDISFEGTRRIARSPTSMEVEWHPETIRLIGGGEVVQIPMPTDLKETLPSALTQISASFQGTSFKLFTNGRQIVDLPNRRFARGEVLRVFLGGQDSDKSAVYLAKLRIAASSGTVAGTTQSTQSSPTNPLPVVSTGATGSTQSAAGPVGTFVPGTRELFASDFSKTAVGQFPAELELRPGGKAEIVDRNGAHMLKASKPTEFVVRLHENLPDAFTVEFDLIPKECCQPQDLSFEGTPAISQSPNSANIQWRTESVMIVGGGETFQMAMPTDLAETTPAANTHVNASFDSSGLKLYTNGRLIASLPDRRFAHGRVLRVFLGGQDDDLNAVYLGRLRIGAGGVPPTIANNSGPTPQSSSTTGTAGSTTAAPAPIGANSEPRPAFTISVAMGANGPIATWPPLTNTSGYIASRVKIDDLNCCNTSTARTWTAMSSWQDQPLPMSGTYLYKVIANTQLWGELTAETQFAFTLPATTTPAPVGAVLVAPTTGTITPTASTSSTSGTSATSATSGTTTSPTSSTSAGTATTGTVLVGAMSSDPRTGTIVPTSSGPGAPTDPTARYRVTLTGLRVSRATYENTNSQDGNGDEVYAAAAVILWDRTTSSVKTRSDVRTREYGDIRDGLIFGNRIMAGTMSATGGIRAGDQVPRDFDPTGSAIPAPATDRFPLLVWEGSLNAGADALLIVPTLWERDVDPSTWVVWKNDWAKSTLTAVFGALPLSDMVANTDLRSALALMDVGVPIVMSPTDLAANLRDHPIGISPKPVQLPVFAAYQDRYVVLTKEKLAALAVGGSTIMPIPFDEPATVISSGMYTLYLRVERVP